MRIALYQGTSWISKAIRWRTRSKYSHAAFLLDDGAVIEMWTDGAREVTPDWRLHPDVRPLNALSRQHTPGTKVDIFKFKTPLTREENRDLENLARLDVRRQVKYDYWGILCFLTRQKDEDRGKLFCSEQVFGRCGRIGRWLLDRTAPWEVPPDWIPRSPLLERDGPSITTI